MAFSSLYIGVTGLLAHGNGMQVLSNNLANVSTTGYKRADTQFQSLISQQLVTGSNPAGSSGTKVSQKGMGVTIGGIKTSFLQGGLEPTRTATDLAISGNGFFGARDSDSGIMHYTRAGAFRFDDQGYLLTPQGLRVQGADIDRSTGSAGSIEDIQLDLVDYTTATGQVFQAVQSAPQASTEIRLSTNLDNAESDMVSSAANPFFSLYESWNASAENPLAAAAYATSMNVYDENGDSHTLNFSFDKVATDTITNPAPGNTYWEYVVGMDPDEDGRTAFQGTSSAGMLSFGTMVFNRDGVLLDQTAYALAAGGDPGTLSDWELAAFDSEGRVAFDVTFGGSGASATTSQTIGYAMGLTSSNGAWAAQSASNAGAVGQNASNVGGMDNEIRDVYGTTSYAKGSSTLIANQDGYARGFLDEIYMDSDGTMIGDFSNGQSEGLFKVGVYRFNSAYGLRREGGNLFLATADSGAAIEGFAEQDGRGTIYGSSLEGSNVDMADQFVRLIMTQRGFQSNTKVITTSDSILQTAISIKK